MRRALHIGLFIGTLIGTSACMTVDRSHMVAHETVADRAALP